MLGDGDTICAIATPRGIGALGIVRISGELTRDILKKCLETESQPFESHRAVHGFWKNSVTLKRIDEVVSVFYSSGRGFTGEEAAEITCHGGPVVTHLILESIQEAGARLARPGEFTYRAVMKGKLDLSRAESVLEVIHARSPRAAALALENLNGALSRRLNEIESTLIFVLANLEASIDFTTEDIQPVSFPQMRDAIGKVHSQVSRLLENYTGSLMVKQGFRVVIVGKPNVGKSSLLNALVGHDRSIVTNAPGTTRDTIDAEFFLDGILIIATDTAGIREARDEAERQGVERAREKTKQADLILYLVDATLGLQNDDLAEIKKFANSDTLICFNKSDLKDIDLAILQRQFGVPTEIGVKTSTVLESGLDSLREKIRAKVNQVTPGEADITLSSDRQKELLNRVQAALERVDGLLHAGSSPEFLALEMKEALFAIQEILGKNASDEVMERVFKEFCIGK